MQRNTRQLKTNHFDVIVIGAGVHGACIARDASLRGLSVALIDKGDICGATSHNSLKTIHGGIRYLQHLNFKRTLECIKEQKYWLKTAPHLIKPLPFLVPIYGHGTRGPEAMWLGTKLYETMCFRRNRGASNYHAIPKGRIISAQECLKLTPSVKRKGLTGGAIWYDAQVENTDRTVIEIAQSAAMNGACIANYVSAENFIVKDNTVIGVSARETLSNKDSNQEPSARFDILGDLVINATGPWAAKLLSGSNHSSLSNHRLPLIKSMNLVTRKILPEHAIGIQSKRQSDSAVGNSKRLYFIVPWRECSIIGTTHFKLDDSDNTNDFSQNTAKTRMEIDEFIHEINDAYPDAKLSTDDIIYCHQGLIPANDSKQHENITHLHHSKIIDHAKSDNINGLVSIISIKWTTARLIAEQATNLAIKKLSTKLTATELAGLKSCQTRDTPLPNANSPVKDIDLQSSSAELSEFVQRAVTEEMTLSLNDLLLRRTDAVMQNLLSIQQIKTLSQQLANHRGWNTTEKQQQLEELQRCWLAPEIKKQLTADLIWS